MIIEISESAFQKLFNSSNLIKVENLEHARKHHYKNNEIEISGLILHNFIGNIVQHYLIDINA